MASRGRGYNQGKDWDPMGDDFDDSNYDPQYPDNNAGSLVNLEHCRLYITNIPKGLNDEGFGAALSKYGTLTELFLNNDPNKRYGLVTYETSGEAKLAMMKLNRTEPLRLNVSIAHKKNKRHDKERTGGDRSTRHRDDDRNNGMRERGSHKDEGSNVGGRDKRDRDNASLTSLERKTRREDMANGDTSSFMNDLPVNIDDDLDLEALDPDLQLELDRLQLEHLKLQQQQVQCKQRMLLKQAEKRVLAAAPTNRQVQRVAGEKLKVVVHSDVPVGDHRDADSLYTAGAGDSLLIPGLQPVGSRACIVCGGAAEALCSRCGAAPYCSERCQRRDWTDRHRAVCHNLARLFTPLDGVDSKDPEATVLPVAPLRRPRSPAPQKERQSDKRDQRNQGFANQRDAAGNQRERLGNQREQAEKEATRDDDFGGQGSQKIFAPPPTASVTGRGGHRTSNRNDNNRGRPPLRHERVNQSDNNEGVASKAAQPVPEPKPRAAEARLPVKSNPEPVKQPPQPLLKQETDSSSQPPRSLSDVTPSRKLVPKNCVIETLSVGETVLLSVDSLASECRAAASGYVCLSMHEGVEAHYQALCDEYGAACDADTNAYRVTPGETFSYFNPEEGAWYRARCLAPAIAALLDSGKVQPLSAGDRCKRLPDKYAAVPEFCCQLQADGVKISDSLRCTVTATTANGLVVTLENVDTGASLGKGELSRWLPRVDYPEPIPTVPAPQVLAEVPRPDVVNNTTVLVVDATSYERTFVRPADTASQRQFDAVLQDVVLFGMKATPLAEPPQKGQVVIGKFTDGLHYRALVIRTNVKMDKYLLEYIEYGNTYISKLENLYPCPPNLDLSSAPTVTSQVTLQGKNETFTPAAIEYLDKLKDSSEEIILTLPNGAKSAPSGSTVVLTVAKNKDVVNRKLDEMCTPEWKQLEERGGDVVQLRPIMFNELEYVELPAGGCALQILDLSGLQVGSVSGYPRGLPHADYVFKQLTDQMAQYCNSAIGREPYLPSAEELCIAQCPPYPQWFRAAVAETPGGPGAPAVSVCYFDYGNVETVPVALLRKMLPEFVRGRPAVCNMIQIADFPKNPTVEQLQKALLHMEIDDEGRGVLQVTRCIKEANGMYRVEAPALIAAMNMP